MSSTISTTTRPETFRLPKPGTTDQFFGFSRSFYYVGEQRRYWKLIRICSENRERGVTLVPFDEVEAFVRRSREERKV